MTRRLRLACIALIATSSACVHRPVAIDLPLQWRGTDDPTSLPEGAASAFAGQSVSIEVAADTRTPPVIVGRNVQDRAKPIPIATRSDVAAFLASNIGSILRANAITVTPTGGSRVIKLDIGTFYVEEENAYQARITLGVVLADDAGRTLWQGTVRGASNRFGRSLSEDNYLEALSNATFDVVTQLLGTAEFIAAVRSHG